MFSKITALSEADTETSYLDAVNDNSASTWMITLKIKGIDVQFKMDTGAITEGTYIALQKLKLNSASKIL